MRFHFEKFLHTKSGKIFMSLLLGFGLASLFRKMCKDRNCIIFNAPPLDQFNENIYKDGKKCFKYVAYATKCDKNKKIIPYETKLDLR